MQEKIVELQNALDFKNIVSEQMQYLSEQPIT